MKYKMWTDGSCLKNPGGPGGWACVIKTDKKTIMLSGFCPTTTNNRMELKAIVEGLKPLRSKSSVVVYSDSRYCVNLATNNLDYVAKKGYRRGEGFMPNADLWAELKEQVDRFETVSFQWVKGHAGNEGNEKCDELAGEAARKCKAVRRQFYP